MLCEAVKPRVSWLSVVVRIPELLSLSQLVSDLVNDWRAMVSLREARLLKKEKRKGWD